MKKNNKQINQLSSWEWTTTICSLRYFEHRASIAASMFPSEVIERYWSSGRYSDNVLRSIAHQFVRVDHHNGESDWKVEEGAFAEDAKTWCKFYAFLKAFLDGFTVVKVKDKGKTKPVDMFFCNTTKRWYPVSVYLSRPLNEVWYPGKVA